MDPSVFNRVYILEYLLDEPGQLRVNLSNFCMVLLEKRLRIGIVGFAWFAAFFWLFWDVIHGGLFVELFAEVRDCSADLRTQHSTSALEHLLHCFLSLLS